MAREEEVKKFLKMLRCGRLSAKFVVGLPGGVPSELFRILNGIQNFVLLRRDAGRRPSLFSNEAVEFK